MAKNYSFEMDRGIGQVNKGGRPRKDGLDFMKVDIHMDSDDKVKVTHQLIRNQTRFEHATRQASERKTHHFGPFRAGVSCSAMRRSEYTSKSPPGGRMINGTIRYPRELVLTWITELGK